MLFRSPVDTPMYLLPNMFVQKVVASAEAEMLTMLFPTRIALNSLLEFSVTFNTLLAFLFPSSARERSFRWLTVVSAVSEEEKKAESASKIRIIISCNAGLLSKKTTPFMYKFPYILYIWMKGVKYRFSYNIKL